MNHFSFMLNLVQMPNQFLLITIIGIIASFIGTLAGGAALITLPVMMLMGIPVQTSIATNKFSSGLAAFSSVMYLLRHKSLSIKMVLFHITIAFIGGLCGALITAHIQESTMRIVSIVLLLSSLFLIIGKKKWTTVFNETRSTKNVATTLIPFFIAAYDGGFGPGSSTFSISYFIRMNETYSKAVQLTRVLILGSCAGAFLVYFQSGLIQWPYALAMAIGSIVGSQIALTILPKVPLQVANVLVSIISCLLIIQMILSF